MARNVYAVGAVLAVALSVVALVGAAAAYNLTTTDVSDMQAVIKDTFGLGNSYGTPCNPCTIGDNVGALVRLAFHDAAGGGGPNGVGGMNGCIDFSTSDNNGLEEVVATLDTIYPDFSSKVSKADFWLIAANLAIQYASTTNESSLGPQPLLQPSPGTLYLPFRYGRVDDANCTGLDAAYLPGAGYSWSQMKAVFQTRMGMTNNQNIAIMGAHSLGRAQYKNSGFEGGWGILQSTFSNFYYLVLGGGPTWINSNASDVWVDTGVTPNTMMLKVDVEPMLSPSANCSNFKSYSGKPGTTGCAINSESNSQLIAYAQSQSLFYEQFSEAWQVMTEFEYSSLSDVSSSSSGGDGSSTSGLTTNDKIIIGVIVGVAGAVGLVGAVLIVLHYRRSPSAAAAADKEKDGTAQEMAATSPAPVVQAKEEEAAVPSETKQDA